MCGYGEEGEVHRSTLDTIAYGGDWSLPTPYLWILFQYVNHTQSAIRNTKLYSFIYYLDIVDLFILLN